MTVRFGVRDRVKGRISAFSTTGRIGLDPRNLAPTDIGRYVIYHANSGDMEAGVISSWTENLIFVRFTGGKTAAGCSPASLELVIAPFSPYKPKRQRSR